MGGRGSLAGLMPYGDANAIVVDMAREVLPVVKETPVLAGVCGTDPFRLMPVFLDELRADRLQRRAELPDRRPVRRHDPRRPRGDRHGLRARGRHDPARARARLPDGAVRLRRRRGDRDGGGGRRRARAAHGPDDRRRDRRRDREDARRVVPLVQAMHDAAKRVNPEILVLCHGGPIAEPDDAAYVLERTPRASSASSARRRWSACRPRSR